MNPTAKNQERRSSKAETSPEAASASIVLAELHAHLHDIASSKSSEQEIRRELRALIARSSGAVGVAHIIQNKKGRWDIDPDHRTGRVPRRDDFVEKFAACCQQTYDRNNVHIEQFLGLECIYAAIQVPGALPEILLVLNDKRKSGLTLQIIEIASAYFGVWLKDRQSSSHDWKLRSLAALIELISEIESASNVTEACQTVVNELTRYLGCEVVAVGLQKSGKTMLNAVSGVGDLVKSGEQEAAIRTALSESSLRGELATFPVSDDANNPSLLLAHKQLKSVLQVSAVISTPLVTPAGTKIGSLLIAGDDSLVTHPRLSNFLRAAAPRIGQALELMGRAQDSRGRRLFDFLGRNIATAKGRVACVFVALFVALMMVPMPYRIRCSCTTEATTRRYAVAPFDGIVEQAFVAPGDRVRRGQLLAKMDSQGIRYELAGVSAEATQSDKRREIELAKRNIPKSLLASLETEELLARKNLLEYQSSRVEITSPLEGVILSGSVERNDGTSVKTGHVLFEVASLSPLRIEIGIPASEVGFVERGQNVRVWIDGLESESFVAKIDRIRPRSELRGSKNVFVAEVTVSNDDHRLRPGMNGSARIDTDSRPLAWNLFHKPWNYLSKRLTWW